MSETKHRLTILNKKRIVVAKIKPIEFANLWQYPRFEKIYMLHQSCMSRVKKLCNKCSDPSAFFFRKWSGNKKDIPTDIYFCSFPHFLDYYKQYGLNNLYDKIALQKIKTEKSLNNFLKQQDIKILTKQSKERKKND